MQAPDKLWSPLSSIIGSPKSTSSSNMAEAPSITLSNDILYPAQGICQTKLPCSDALQRFHVIAHCHRLKCVTMAIVERRQDKMHV